MTTGAELGVIGMCSLWISVGPERSRLNSPEYASTVTVKAVDRALDKRDHEQDLL